MRYTIDYYFTDGQRKVNLVVFHFDGNKITYEITYSGETIDTPFFDPVNLPEHIQHIINLPLLRANLRARTMPAIFKPLEPNTLEHFENLRHDTTYFKFSPMKRLSPSAKSA